jgi:hypothetical protein
VSVLGVREQEKRIFDEELRRISTVFLGGAVDGINPLIPLHLLNE